MSEYWKSTTKKFCDYCKIWIADNKASINIHESGRKHKENVKVKLAEIKKKSNEKKSEEMKTAKAMAAIEKAAVDAMKKDLSSNPKLKNQYGNEVAKAADAANLEEVKEKKTIKASTSKVKSTTTNNQAIKRKADSEPEAKIGKWERVITKEPTIELNSSIDLQLPSSSGNIVSSKLESSVEQLQNDLDNLEKEIISTVPKPKWTPIGFQPIDQAQSESAKKEDYVELVKEEIKQEQKEESQVKPEDPPIVGNEWVEVGGAQDSINETKCVEKPAEKVVTLDGVFKSSKKTVAFKKRSKTDSVRLRERADD